ncbi:MAG: NTP transferase domain-containing protein [Lachnospiraceae bacterium]|nr:NTP transferase domain-containing protein [Lachnospiraceae bacterium]
MLDYIIVQAGGKGTRLGYLTKNKPKALAPVENLPMIFHLFRKYPDKRFVIIADYKKEVFKRYMECFADVRYRIVEAAGTGTSSGVGKAIELIPDHKPFMLIWSDLILPDKFELPDGYLDSSSVTTWESQKKDYIGVSSTFPCRWKYEDDIFAEERSVEHGVAGFFLFHDKSSLSGVPESGELVRWMQEKEMRFEEISLAGTREFGLLEEYERLENIKTRPFNRITVDGGVLTKESVDAQGEYLAKRERAWYEKAQEKHITGIPDIYGLNPLRMEVVRGKNIYDMGTESDEKYRILCGIVDILRKLHMSEVVPADSFSLKEAYFNKTMSRLSQIEDLVPFGRERYIRVNGRVCRNIYFYKDKLEHALEQLKCSHFSFIHGDCTFSNLMLRDNGETVLIDPRGYFGFTELYGDERYDWAKLYYSVVGNYDRFNLKKFSLDIGENADEGVKLSIESNGWEDMEDEFFELTGAVRYEIKLLHAVIWLSLTTYAWQDYDSICGAFYNGLYYLEEVL